jgi:flagellar hook assembly protein FlgD
MRSSSTFPGLFSRALAILVFLAAAALPATAFDPPSGSALITDLYSPSALAGGDSAASTLSPNADSVNPAASAGQQRVTVEASYVNLSSASEPKAAGGFNLGGSLPTRAGVVSVSGHFLSSTFSDMPWGTSFALKGSFAKDLYPDLYVGAGLGLTLGSGVHGASDWGLGLDLGVLGLAGNVGFMKDLRWGIALDGIGKGFDPSGTTGSSGGSATAFPAPFTLASGVSFDYFQTGKFKFGAAADLRAPSFQDLTLSASANVRYADAIQFTTRLLYLDMNELINSKTQKSFIPSFGLSGTFHIDSPKSDSILSKSEISPTVAAAPLYGGVWAVAAGVNASLGVIDRNPPKMAITYPETLYISPNHDGIQDDVTLPISITDERYVMGYSLKIFDANGTLVREIKNKEKRPENGSLANIWARLTTPKSGIDVPKSLRWDGISDSGTVVPDGSYSFTLESFDDNGNRGTTAASAIVVRDTPPSVEIVQPAAADDLVFSPDGDGNKDTLTIRQSGSVEDLWTAAIRDPAGNAVRTVKYQNSAPSDFVWDGKNDSGSLVPDGVYRYDIGSKDRAGNATTKTLDNIIVNTQQPPVGLTIGTSDFSPNGDGIKDTLTLGVGIPVKSGLVSWSLVVRDKSGSAVRSYGPANFPQPPDSIAFDGRSQTGSPLPQGEYRADLAANYRNGYNPKAKSPVFRIDLTAPTASASANYDLFSPNGDGNKDTLAISQTASPEDLWTGIIRDQAGATVKSFTWHGTVDPQVIWDGRDDSGKPVKDGPYAYQLSSVDRAGNSGKSAPVSFSIDTRDTPVFIQSGSAAFSPNADGIKDTVELLPRIQEKAGIDRWSVTILDASGKAVKTVTGKGSPLESIVWNGTDSSGAKVPDGTYSAKIDVNYTQGNAPSANSAPFLLKTSFPQAEVGADRVLFSPSETSSRKTVTIRQSSKAGDDWHGAIYNSRNEAIRSYEWKGALADQVWDGTDDAGNLVPDGSYRYVVFAQDAAGNRTEKTVPSIVVDSRPAQAFLTVNSPGFSPNGDGYLDTIKLTPVVSLSDGIEDWSLRIQDKAGKTVRSYPEKAGAPIPSSIVWDGRNSAGGMASNGIYSASFSVRYLKGEAPSATSASFLLGLDGPSTSIKLSPVPFSPDNDGIDDEVTILVDVSDPSPIRDWSLKIDDPAAHPFIAYGGTGSPSRTIVWDGRSATGELVQAAEDYPFTFTVTDILGNSSVTRGMIPVDVLVIRVGDQLKIAISSIVFPGFSADLSGNPEKDKNDKNARIVSRVAQILNKFKDYRIRIEGHAVNLTGTPKEETEELIPLSTARASSVLQKLVQDGVAADRLTAVGLGSENPIVPDTDLDNRWKNRRVEFILIKK